VNRSRPNGEQVAPSAARNAISYALAVNCAIRYLQRWNARLGAEPIPERSAQRIFKAADQILKAGTAEATDAGRQS
jgi:hypothetical protein